MSNQYAERDASGIDGAGGYYIRHVSAMTKEGLHSKGDIAAELGFRDMQIDALTKQRDELLDAICGIVDFIEIDEIKIDSLALNIAREAIAKAKAGAVNHFPDAAKMVPGGLWQMVPVVATKAMWAAWDSAPCNNEDDAVNLEAAYSAMLAAAPKFEGGAA